MAYQKNTWASGDVVTSAKLNNIENGIAGGGVLVVGYTMDNGIVTLDKTYTEIVDAAIAVINLAGGEDMPTTKLYYSYNEPDNYNVNFCTLGGAETFLFHALSADGYPFMSMG